jgi:5'-3' exonuclease
MDVDAPLLIADVPWLLYRANFSLPKSIKGSDGKPVNALLGTVNALLVAIESERPRAVVACFGAEEARYRVKAYPAYHAHRDPMPEDLATQWRLAPGLLASFAWHVADAGDLEADDAMGSYARTEAEAGGRALLLTADRDLYQAVDEHVAVLDLGKGGACVSRGPEHVQKSYGVSPNRVPDFIALRGDPSDGIPGAPGIGAKTAAELLRAYGTLEALLEAAEQQMTDANFGDLRPRVASALSENADLLRTFREIATLVPIEVERPPATPTDFAGGAAKAQELGMKRLAERLSSQAT